MSDTINTIEASLDVCNEHIGNHRKKASRLLIFIFLVTTLFIAGQAAQSYATSYSRGQYISYLRERLQRGEKVDNTSVDTKNERNTALELTLYGIFVLIFSVLTSFYKFHLKEISKYEHFLIGLHRIRIAANNLSDGFKTEVRNALTEDAFRMESKAPLFAKEKKIESPIPGHPTSDLGTYIVNKLFDFMKNQEKSIAEKGTTPP